MANNRLYLICIQCGLDADKWENSIFKIGHGTLTETGDWRSSVQDGDALDKFMREHGFHDKDDGEGLGCHNQYALIYENDVPGEWTRDGIVSALEIQGKRLLSRIGKL